MWTRQFEIKKDNYHEIGTCTGDSWYDIIFNNIDGFFFMEGIVFLYLGFAYLIIGIAGIISIPFLLTWHLLKSIKTILLGFNKEDWNLSSISSSIKIKEKYDKPN